MKKIIIIYLLTSNVVFAQEMLKKITITSNVQYAQNIDNVINSVTVITQQEITDLQPSTVLELLNTVAGLHASSNGGKGTKSSIFLRGFSGTQTVVLIDGVMTSSSVDGSFSWETLDPEIIEKIEIIKGAKAIIHGSDARAIINIVTKKHGMSYIKLTTGSFNTDKKTISIGVGAPDTLGMHLVISDEKSDGFSATNSKIGNNFDDDNDSFNNNSTNLNLWAKLFNNIKTNILILDSKTKAGYDQGTGFPAKKDKVTDSVNIDKSLVSFKISHQVNNHWDYFIRSTDSKQTNFNQGSCVYSCAVDTKKTQTNLINRLIFNQHKILFGTDTISSKNNNDKAINENAKFINFYGAFNKFSYEFGYRQTHHNIFGNFHTNQIGLAYKFNINLSLKTTQGTSMKVPTSDQLYGAFGVPGNKSLDPETAEISDISLVYRGLKNNFEISAYQAKIKNPITYVSFTTGYQNTYAYSFNGVDVTYRRKFNHDLNLRLTLTKLNYQTINNGDSANTTRAALKRPNKLSVIINHKLTHNINTTAHMLLVGESTDYQDKLLSSYNLINLSLNYKMSKYLSLNFKIDNALNEKYETSYGYNTAERSYYLNLMLPI